MSCPTRFMSKIWFETQTILRTTYFQRKADRRSEPIPPKECYPFYTTANICLTSLCLPFRPVTWPMKTHVFTPWVALSHRRCPQSSAGSVTVDLWINRRTPPPASVCVGAKGVSAGVRQDGTASARSFPLAHTVGVEGRPGWNERRGRGWCLIV